ncbi:N-formylglutamate amidohydrolase [Jannaschia ovalis]|uniref:N-formylglutamate amidohydrolase n=1 Tax=Jannaschia ovalis TaxID=3038773 RepID=A0ABY8L8I8_9RHOB|nr:N-formylglutamate amidohydrolase [Jannaschia sp. GRR-S6-38]WGH77681.1 N-formylglutamate amidohydrolase [Jannaschia sp. GRR-S6-38]
MSRPPFRLVRPAVQRAPVVVASPHSGRVYDWEFLTATVLDAARIRSSEDAFVDLLMDRAPDLGMALLAAEMPRAFLDLNRAPDELDPGVIQGLPRGVTNPRIASGLGVIPRVVAQGRAIYSGKIDRAEAQARIDRVWHPYHDQLAALMGEASDRFGRAILLDCHSMPHEAIESSAPRGRAPEIVLGDRFGASAGAELVDHLESIFAELGFRVARNAPFAGAYIARAYGKPQTGWHVIQIEIDRALYMDEAALRPSPEFDNVKRLMTEALSRFSVATRGAQDLAAE